MKVAIVHYWLVSMRGGEKVIEALLEIFPQADIYTHVYNPAALSSLITSKKVYTSFINKLPFAKKLYQKYMPLMPSALNDFNLQEYDLIISSESGPAKGVVPNPLAYHICYCHTPMRYLWDMYHDYFRKTGFITRFFMKCLIPNLRLWDITSSNLVDTFIANSNYVAGRIRRYYNRSSQIIFPPVDVKKYIDCPRSPSDFYLFFGQLVDYKRVDIAIEACVMAGKKLVISGAGAKKKDIKRYEKTGLIKFLGRVSDDEMVSLFSRAKALLFPGIEDFGIIPVEANAAGCPVIAYRRGGALDTIKENATGIFFDEQTPEALASAIAKFESMEASFGDRDVFTEWTAQFSKDEFKKRVRSVIDERRRI
jgi:glycosyltransferase involved in cell wall biosynthesis